MNSFAQYFLGKLGLPFIKGAIRTVNATSDHTLWTLYRSHYKGISAKIELQMYSETSC
jgi:hypothetical protein